MTNYLMNGAEAPPSAVAVMEAILAHDYDTPIPRCTEGLRWLKAHGLVVSQPRKQGGNYPVVLTDYANDHPATWYAALVLERQRFSI